MLSLSCRNLSIHHDLLLIRGAEWILKGAFIKSGNFGEYNWDTENTAVNLSIVLSIDYAILNF